MNTYYARLCWNSERWSVPTREVQEYKLEQPKSYALSQGFGHEEWLFDFTNSVDGYQYGFLQPVHRKGSSWQGTAIGVVLYTLNPAGQRVLVGDISTVKILTSEEQRTAFEENTRNGRIERMRAELIELGVDVGPLGVGDLFNIRFLKKDVTFADQPYAELLPLAHFKNLKHYDLYPVLSGPVRTKRPDTPSRKNDLPTTREHKRRAIATAMVTDHHLQLQRALRDLLIKHFGTKHVSVEEKGVDLLVRKGRRKMLIELKSDSDIKVVLRQALGQVMEYAHWPTREEFNELFIVAPAPETRESKTYMSILKKKYKMPIVYCSFSVGDQLPASFLRQ